MTLNDTPEWWRATVVSVIVLYAILVFVVVIMLVSHWTAGPPATCGSNGVKQVLRGNDGTTYEVAIVCNNGETYMH